MPVGPIIGLAVLAVTSLVVMIALLGVVQKFEGAAFLATPTVEIPALTEAPELADTEHHWLGEAFLVCEFSLEHACARMVVDEHGEYWLRSWVSADRRVRAVAATLIPRTGHPVHREPFTQVTLTSQISLGGEMRDLVTTDSVSAAAWTASRQQVVRLSGASAEALWHIHRSRIDEATGDAVSLIRPELASDLEATHAAVVEQGLADGLLERTEDVVELTRAGAWAATRVHMQPWASRHDVRDRRAADTWLVS